MSKEPKTNEEVSVEEILRSIRKVINGHSTKPSDDEDNDEDILELTEDEVLVSDRVAEEAKDSLKDFAAKVHESKRSNMYHTIDDLMIDTVKQEIKTWMNANLPTIVKQIVEKEIKRLIPKDN